MLTAFLKYITGQEGDDKEKARKQAIEAELQAAREAWRRSLDNLGIPPTFTNSIGMEFVAIPPGEFMMGSLSDNYHPLHAARISHPFYLDKYPVTQEDYRVLHGGVGANPSCSGRYLLFGEEFGPAYVKRANPNKNNPSYDDDFFLFGFRLACNVK